MNVIQKNAAWAVVEEHEPDDLLACLKVIASHHGRPSSDTVLTAGLPLVGEPLTAKLFMHSAERVGLATRIVRWELSELVSVYLPAVVYVRGGQPIVLFSFDEAGEAEVFLPRAGGMERLTFAELQKLYDGTAILSKPQYRIGSDVEAPAPVQGHWFWGTIRRYRRNYAFVALAALFINMLALALPLFIMNVYDRVLPNNAMVTLWVLAVGLVIALVFDLILKSARAVVIDRVGRNVDLHVSTAIFDKILNIPLAARPGTTGALSSRLGEYELVREFFTSTTVALVVDLSFMGLFLLVIFALCGWVVIIPMTGIILVIVTGLWIQHLIARGLAEARNESTLRNSLLVDALGGIETVKSICAEGYLLHKWESLIRQGSGAHQRVKSLSSAGVNISAFIQLLVTAGIVVAGAYRFSSGAVSMGAIIATVILSSRAMSPLAQIAMTMVRGRYAFLALSGLNKIMELPDERVATRNFVNRTVLSGKIEIKGVDFTYPHSRRSVLKGLDVTIKPGERVGIIGRVGSGKTTIGRLISGLYQPTAGEILLDEVDIRQYHPHEVRKAIALVVQDAELFSGTIKENILMARPTASDEELLQAARISGVEDFVSVHPLGFDLPVGERGSQLSGGQRQAVALARILVGKQRVLFLDEPSSAMDNTTEQQMIAHLSEAIAPDQTLILSTHRHSMLALVDRLLLLNRGAIVMDGPKDEVLRQLAQSGAVTKAKVTSRPRGG